ncbi:GntR family transcriptional regulator [Teichococcus oryzae]|nr:GntR family transcriptional regulator [Pseudoroseomonas oryzae]
MGSLHVLLAHRVLDHIRAEGLPAGHHLTEQSLEPVLGTSRSPIRGALAHLAAQGVLVPRPPRRGLFLARDAAEMALAEDLPGAPAEERAYLALARARLAGELPAVLSESEAMRRTGLARDALRRVLARAAQEGWIEQRPSRRWSFLPMIDGPEACAESYALRAALEPAALRMPGFAPDPAVLERLRAQQRMLAEGGVFRAGDAELFAANSTFHESLATLSGNRFVLQMVVRQNQLRRLVEYRAVLDRGRVRHQCFEHLSILDRLMADDRDAAARLLEGHLVHAGEEKVRLLRRAGGSAETTKETP